MPPPPPPGSGRGRTGGRKRAAPGSSRNQLVTLQDEPQEQEADPRGQAECAAGAEGLAGLDPAQLLRELLAESGGRGGERAANAGRAGHGHPRELRTSTGAGVRAQHGPWSYDGLARTPRRSRSSGPRSQGGPPSMRRKRACRGSWSPTPLTPFTRPVTPASLWAAGP